MHYFTERITIDSNLCNGRPTIRGQRITAQTILEHLYAEDSFETILENYPTLEEEDIKACMAFAIQVLDKKYIVKPVA